ncbi:hypothetical protein COW99_01165 [Candidatus Roizmanbacteria bacterium CG22_combo_CG10-13_8_21_14_all_38_20]|uniref:Bacterial spore germination immunoglobulin-like domain-containing protein n=1 Tax=Candidatus Roizmanbacteria bacterium CG22_combo_CG10-13_8_21_14_all_38_20 TaxID=1974862 RepID=A0A2H0BWE7_9BACT|nr:hypothetical protein [Candidatus Microgenomates bacterium]PIP61992.1 MAG: hypothetical protein COW99_01165 [Candidatus Roizmanbacteria bacterium CG22_combo_CG10-13_8_21_14_all_38_20]PJC31349.1 MAG: hypothetical protein CO050_03730 [Candidatus Roizmanbacteria bacterium CG_4_9_14_0_2_um_filter_38_17]
MKIINLALFLYIVSILVCPSVYAQPLDPSIEGYDQVKTPLRPSLKIVSPQTGSTVLGNRITMEYIVSGVKLISPEDATLNVRGEGHLLISFAKADIYGPEGTFQTFIHKSPIIFENIPEGDYILIVEVVKNRGDSYEPAVKEEVQFAVRHVVKLSPTPPATPTPTPETATSIVINNKQNILFGVGIVLVLLPATFLMSRGIRKIGSDMV